MRIFEITKRIDVYERNLLVMLENLYNRYAASYDVECNEHYLEDINSLLEFIVTRNRGVSYEFINAIKHNITHHIKRPVYIKDFRKKYYYPPDQD